MLFVPGYSWSCCKQLNCEKISMIQFKQLHIPIRSEFTGSDNGAVDQPLVHRCHFPPHHRFCSVSITTVLAGVWLATTTNNNNNNSMNTEHRQQNRSHQEVGDCNKSSRRTRFSRAPKLSPSADDVCFFYLASEIQLSWCLPVHQAVRHTRRSRQQRS